MYFILLFIVSWIWFFIQADKKRLRELFGAAVFSSFLGLLTDLIMVEYKLWSYHGLPQPTYLIPLLLDFSVYPVVAGLFVQNLPSNWGGILKRIAFWTFGAVLFEWITLKFGYIKHHLWWTLWLSMISDIVIFLMITAVYKFYRPVYKAQAPTREG